MLKRTSSVNTCRRSIMPRLNIDESVARIIRSRQKHRTEVCWAESSLAIAGPRVVLDLRGAQDKVRFEVEAAYADLCAAEAGGAYLDCSTCEYTCTCEWTRAQWAHAAYWPRLTWSTCRSRLRSAPVLMLYNIRGGMAGNVKFDFDFSGLLNRLVGCAWISTSTCCVNCSVWTCCLTCFRWKNTVELLVSVEQLGQI